MNFDEIVSRKNTGSVKWDTMTDHNKPADALPLWVADMDFQAPEAVLKAIAERVSHGIFGYPVTGEGYFEAVKGWMQRRHHWLIEKDWIIPAPGVVPAINFIIQTFTKPNDAILVQRPVYNPFTDSIKRNNRKVVNSPLVLKQNKFEIDFTDFENKIVSENVKMFILCNPHNPVGRVWTKEELVKIGDICLKHDVLVIADEIHHDLIFKEYTHTVFASVSEFFSDHCITCTAPSKTFNLAGLKTANIIIKNPDLRNRLKEFIDRLALGSVSTFGQLSCEVAYNEGDVWVDELMDYIEENKNYVTEFIHKQMPLIQVTECEGTYLLWLDFRRLGMDTETLENFLIREAKLWLNEGSIYGEEGTGFERLNIACPRKILIQALNQLDKAYRKKF